MGRSSSMGTHLAVTLENGTFLDNELLGLDVADKLGVAFEDELKAMGPGIAPEELKK